MRAFNGPTVAVILLLAGVLALLGFQRRTTERLREEVAGRRARGDSLARLQSERERLRTAQVSPGELKNLTEERLAVSALWEEIELMKRRAEIAARAVKIPGAQKTTGSPGPRFSLKDGPMTAAQWSNVGRATPDATMETALWAAAGGDVEALAGLLTFDSGARGAAGAFFARLPVALQREVGTPEKLIALLAANDVPPGRAQILMQHATQLDARLTLQLVDAAENTKTARLQLRAEGDKWQLVVPLGAVENYAGQRPRFPPQP